MSHPTTQYAVAGQRDDRAHEIRSERAEPGGNRIPVTFTEGQQEVLNVIADELIPPGGGFPAPSDVNIVGFIARYVTPAADRHVRFPHAKENEFKAALEKLGPALVGKDRAVRVEVLKGLENDDPTLFGQLRTMTYAGYYSRPEVVSALRTNLPAARDYHGAPLPYGYAEVTKAWDEEMPRPTRGAFIPTAEVKRLAG